MMNIKDCMNKALQGDTHLYWMGQAGFVVKNKEGHTLGIDLYLSDCVEPVEGHDGYHRLMPSIVAPEQLQLDVIIATHFHRDHFDIDAIPQLMANSKTMLFCAEDCVDDVKALGINEARVTYVKPGSHCECCGFTMDFVCCDHGTGAPQAVGVIITTDDKRILEVGDTCLHLDWKEEYLSQGDLDVLIAPINGAYGNLNELECASLAQELQPKVTVPCHFGMFASHGGNAGMFIEQMRKQESPYRLLTMGEGMLVK